MKSLCMLALFGLIGVTIPSMKNFTSTEMIGVCLMVYLMVEMIKCGPEEKEK